MITIIKRTYFSSLCFYLSNPHHTSDKIKIPSILLLLDTSSLFLAQRFLVHLQNYAGPQYKWNLCHNNADVLMSVHQAPKWDTSFTNYRHHDTKIFKNATSIAALLQACNILQQNNQWWFWFFAIENVFIKFHGRGSVFRNYGLNPSLGWMTSFDIAMTGWWKGNR